MERDTRVKPELANSTRWYELFSRGARDWLRHNEKIRESVRAQLPELIGSADIVDTRGQQRLRVPVRFLEHFRFRLNESADQTGVGQGDTEPGDVLRRARGPGERGREGAGGNEQGGVEFVIELTVDDIVDWMWQELELPNLEHKQGGMEEQEYTREGWDRRGARSRLDRRRSLRESIKRRALDQEGPTITNDDLRFRQLVQRKRPAHKAVVFFVMDVSASMTEHDRQLAKTFFFWVVQGLRRQYQQLECVFVAHTERAWQFEEEEFFAVKGSGGTMASTAFTLVGDLIAQSYAPAAYNIYMFYASDGDNFIPDRAASTAAAGAVCEVANYAGFVEISSRARGADATEMLGIFRGIAARNERVGAYRLLEDADVWDAIKSFFTHTAESE